MQDTASSPTVRVKRYLCSVLTEGGRGPYQAVGQVFVPADDTTGRESFIFQCDGAVFAANAQNKITRMCFTGGVYPVSEQSTVEEVDLPTSLVDEAYELVVMRRAYEKALKAFQRRMNAPDDPAGFAPPLRAHILAEIAAGDHQGHAQQYGGQGGAESLVYVYSLGSPNHHVFCFHDGAQRITATRAEYDVVVQQIENASRHRHSHD